MPVKLMETYIRILKDQKLIDPKMVSDLDTHGKVKKKK